MTALFPQAIEFRADFYDREAALMHRLSGEGQKPEAMLIGCSDSRVIPEIITGSKPGDLFVVRNIANIVPPFGVGDSCVGAALEYAFLHLHIHHLIICGHLDCGGIKSLDSHINMATEPSINRWIEWARPAQQSIDATTLLDGHDRHRRIVESNVLFQLQNLETYDCVAQSLKREELELHGWVFDIGNGQVWVGNRESGLFNPMEIPV